MGKLCWNIIVFEIEQKKSEKKNLCAFLLKRDENYRSWKKGNFFLLLSVKEEI